MSKSVAFDWVEAIVNRLFEPDNRRMKQEIIRLNDLNSQIKKQRFFGFIHHGQRFLDPRYQNQAAVLARQQMPTLSLHLNPEIKQFDSDRNRLEIDKGKIKQALVPLLINCNNLQDICDSLPECLLHLVPEVAGLKKQFTTNTIYIRSDKFAMKAYEKALPLMQAYSVAGLII